MLWGVQGLKIGVLEDQRRNKTIESNCSTVDDIHRK